jgi:hypothetical protein
MIVATYTLPFDTTEHCDAVKSYEILMKLEASLVGENNLGRAQVQLQMVALTIQLQEITKGEENYKNVWCTTCKTKCHHKNECTTFQQYLRRGSPNPLGIWCEICNMMGHQPHSYPLMQKYQITTRNLFCNICKSVGHEEKDCHTFDLMRECTIDAYRVQGEESKGGAP